MDDENLNETLEKVFNNIELSAQGSDSEDDFKGLFDDIDVNSNKLGATVAKRNDKLVKLMDGGASMKLGNYKDNTIDAFGDAYEFLMGMYASNAGKSGGEYYTPQEVSEHAFAKATFGGYNMAMVDEFLDELTEDYTALYNDNACFIMAEDGEGGVLGYAGLTTVLDEGYINNIAVEEAARKHGVASALLDVFVRFGAVNLAFLTLEVRDTNAAARALYAKHGYEEVGRRKNYYDHPKEDAIIMTRFFGEQA